MKKISLIITVIFACIFLLSGCRKEEYVVTFNPNGGKGVIVTQTFTVKVSQPLMANSFINKGFTFTGWNSRPDGSGVSYKDLEIVKISENIVLYAQWTPATGEFSVTFKANGGAGEMEPQKFEAEVPQALAANRFTNDNHFFSGWCTLPNGDGKKFDNQQIITITSDMTLYAQWKCKSHTYFVTFNPNGGEGTMEPQAFVEGTYQELDSNKFKRENYIFIGWNTKADGSGYHFRDKKLISLCANLYLYAQWTNAVVNKPPCPGIPKVEDIDGNSYNTVQIGSQCWLRENLKTTKYNTGAKIPIITDDDLWSSEEEPAAMCYYNNDVKNSILYGALYNGSAANTGILCPTGWHIPSESEWDILANELGGMKIAGYKMKTVYDWDDGYGETGNGNNESGFSALPAGYRQDFNSGFYHIGKTTFFWSSSIENGVILRILHAYSKELLTSSWYSRYGCSVRCIKD